MSTDLRRKLATGCRILAHEGLAEDILGHISVRVATDEVLIRCRGADERGLLFTQVNDIKRVSLDGSILDEDEGFLIPNEFPLHAETLRARPDVDVVLHAHPPAVIAAELAGLAFLPMVGAYNIPAAKLASDGIPVYKRGVLINTAALAAEMLKAMDGRVVCLLRGHGITTVGTSVEQAVARALAVNSLAKMIGRVVSLGGTPRALATEDLEQLPDLGSTFNDNFLWQHYEHRLRHGGLAI